MTETRDVNDLQKQAGQLFQQTILTDLQQQELSLILKQFSPDELRNFIEQNEASLFSQLADNAQISLDSANEPWAIKDMNSYYILHPANQETRKYLNTRRSELIVQNCISVHDDLQLAPDKNLLVSESAAQLNTCFNQLKRLAHARACLNSDLTSEQYYFKYLFALLSHYKSKLNASLEMQENKKTDVKIEYQTDIVTKIDWINRYFAEYFDKLISTQQVDNHAIELKEMLLQLGELTEEIYPWLSVIFRKRLCDVEAEHVSNLQIESFLSFHSLLHDKSLGERIFNINGESSIPFIKQFLQKDRMIWNGINVSDLEKKLINIKHYLRQVELSPWVMTKICKEILPLAKTSLGSRPDFAFIIYNLNERIKRDNYRFKNAHDAISNGNSDHMCPALKVSVLEITDQAITHALDSGFLPPSAQLLYGMWGKNPVRTKKIIGDLAAKFPRVLHETLLIIFSDDKYAKQHAHWLGLRVHPLIDDNHYPLFALKRAYADVKLNDDKIFQLWMQFIDSGMMINTPFLASDENQQLFAKLKHFVERIDKTTSLTHDQIRTLGIGLSLYRATQIKQYALETSPLLPAWLTGEPRIEYVAESNWAEECLQKLMKRIIYPTNLRTHIDFDGIVQFLDLDFSKGSTSSPSTEVSEEKVLNDLTVIFNKNLHINFDHQFKLFHVMARLFLMNQKPGVLNFPNVSDEFINKLPPIGHALLGIMDSTIFVDVPEWFSVNLRTKIFAVIKTTSLNQGLVKAKMAPHMLSIQNYIDQANPEEKEELQQRMAKRFPASWGINTPGMEQQQLKIKMFFVKQLYLAYCKRNNLVTGDALINRELIRNLLNEEIISIDNEMAYIKSALLAHDEITEKKYSGWKSSFGSILGYNLQESKAQLAHLKAIESFIAKNDIVNLQNCDNLLDQITLAVEKGLFKISLLSENNLYHNCLKKLVAQLSQLRQKVYHYSILDDVAIRASSHNDSMHSSIACSPYTLYSNGKSKGPEIEVNEEKRAYKKR